MQTVEHLEGTMTDSEEGHSSEVNLSLLCVTFESDGSSHNASPQCLSPLSERCMTTQIMAAKETRQGHKCRFWSLPVILTEDFPTRIFQLKIRQRPKLNLDPRHSLLFLPCQSDVISIRPVSQQPLWWKPLAGSFDHRRPDAGRKTNFCPWLIT